MRDDLFPSGIHFNQEDATNEVRKEMQKEMEVTYTRSDGSEEVVTIGSILFHFPDEKP